MASEVLRGITWNHSRGYTSIVGVSQRYSELNPETEITWDKRSLSEFESKPIDQLAREYDLLIIDHPWAGFAARHGVLLPLGRLLPQEFLEDQRKNSVGASFESYDFDGFQSALPIDAASPVAVWRPDLLGQDQVPHSFEETLELAHKGWVIYAATPTYLLMDFYGMCATAGGSLFSPELGGHVVEPEVAERVLSDMRRLAEACPKVVFSLNPITMCETLASTDDYLFCPFVYGYVNYSRRGYAPHRLKAGEVVSYQDKPFQGVLGGTGLAISAKTRNAEACARFVQYAASPDVQRTLYCECGGQPGHRSAWTDAECNRQTLGFFSDTLGTLDRAYLRPRYSGYLSFQDGAGQVLYEYVQAQRSQKETIAELDRLYAASLAEG